MPSAYELHEIVDFVGDAIDEASRAVSLPEEVAALADAIDAQLNHLEGGAIDDFAYWDAVHTALESYRWATDATFTGEFVTKDAASMGKASGIFGRILKRMDVGVARALTYATDEHKQISPSYFTFTVTKHSLTGKMSPGVLPLFLEGPTRHLKILKKANHAAKLDVY